MILVFSDIEAIVVTKLGMSYPNGGVKYRDTKRILDIKIVYHGFRPISRCMSKMVGYKIDLRHSYRGELTGNHTWTVDF